DQGHLVFNDREFLADFLYQLNQYYSLIIKTTRIRLSELISRNGNDNGIFKMDINSLNPYTILYNTDSSIEKYFHATVNNAKLEQSLGIISQMNKNIWQKRIDYPYTYTDIYLGFNIPKAIDDIHKIEALSSNLISGFEIVSIAPNTFYKYI
ncbi:unnamed protein product, partial [Rotaria sp. Silwood2]